MNDQTRAIEHWAVSWSAHDIERLLPLFTEDVIYEDVTMGVMTRGAAELRAFAEGVFSRFPDVTFELQSSFADGTRGEKIRRCSDYWDMATYLKQLGLMPSA